MYAHDRDHGRAHVHACDRGRLERFMNLALVLDRVQSLGHRAHQRGGEESCH
jgi:hypothetical protein